MVTGKRGGQRERGAGTGREEGGEKNKRGRREKRQRNWKWEVGEASARRQASKQVQR